MLTSAPWMEFNLSSSDMSISCNVSTSAFLCPEQSVPLSSPSIFFLSYLFWAEVVYSPCHVSPTSEKEAEYNFTFSWLLGPSDVLRSAEGSRCFELLFLLTISYGQTGPAISCYCCLSIFEISSASYLPWSGKRRKKK